MKRSFFVKMLMFMFGIAVFGNVDDGVGGVAGALAAEAEATRLAAEAEAEAARLASIDKEKGKGVSDSEAALLKEVMEKKAEAKAAKEQLAQVKAQLSQFDGINLEEVKALLQANKESDIKKLEDKGEYDRLKANLLEQHSAEKTALQELLDAAKRESTSKDGLIHGLTIGSAFSASPYIAEELILTPGKAQIIYGSHFEFQDGKIVGYDKPAGSSERTQLIDSKGDPLNFEAAIAKLVQLDPEKNFVVRSKAKPGAKSGSEEGVVTPKKVEVKGQSRIAAAIAAK